MVAWEQQCPTMYHKEHYDQAAPAAGRTPTRKRIGFWPLEPEDYDALMREAKIVPLKFRKRLLLQDEPVDAVYFPITAMISLLVTTDGQPQMEMATIGKEGVVGASELLQTRG